MRASAPPREGQTWQLYDELVLIVGRLVPSWGPGYEGVEVHDAIYLSNGKGCLLEESYLLRDASRVL